MPEPRHTNPLYLRRRKYLGSRILRPNNLHLDDSYTHIIWRVKEVTLSLKSRFEELAEKPKTDNIRQLFLLLRKNLVQCPEELGRWIACLALVRSWRDKLKTIEQIEDTLQKITCPGGREGFPNGIEGDTKEF